MRLNFSHSGSAPKTLFLSMWLVLVLNLATDAGDLVTVFGSGVPATRTQVYAANASSTPARATPLGNPFGIETQGTKVWITTVDDHCVWQASVDPQALTPGNTAGGPLTRVAGCGIAGYSGDGGPAVDATFNWPHEVRVDSVGNLFVADTRNHAIRRIDVVTGVITTIAGDGTKGSRGDGDLAVNARFNQPHSVVLDGRGGLLIADTLNHRIRRLELSSGIVSTICGTGQKAMPTEGAKASGSALHGPRSLAVDDKSIWIALREGNSVWRIDRSSGTIHHVAGTGKKGFGGDDGPLAEMTFSGPKGLAIDSSGRLLVVDTENHAIRRLDLATGTGSTIAGGSKQVDGEPLRRPHGIAPLPGGGYLVGDSESHRVIGQSQ